MVARQELEIAAATICQGGPNGNCRHDQFIAKYRIGDNSPTKAFAIISEEHSMGFLLQPWQLFILLLIIVGVIVLASRRKKRR